MDKLDRIQKLHQIFINRRYPVKLRTLADQLGCTEKSALRLIHVLEDLTLAPIEYSKEHKGWHYAQTSDEFKAQLPGLWLTAEELQSMALLLHILQNFGNGLLNDELKLVEKEIHKLLLARKIKPEDISNKIKVLPIGHQSVSNEIYLRVSSALFQKKQLLLTYCDYKGRVSLRSVSPQNIIYYRDNWYLDAWCHSKKGLRQFLLSRMTKIALTSEAAKVVPRDELDDHFSSAYGIFSGPATDTAVLRFYNDVAKEVSQQEWHPQQAGQWDGNQYVLSLPYKDKRELLRDLMRYVPDVRIDSPATLRSSFHKRLTDGITRLDQ